MIDSRVCPNATGPSCHWPAWSGPRCLSASRMRSTAVRSAARPSKRNSPHRPHIVSGVGGLGANGGGTPEAAAHAPARRIEAPTASRDGCAVQAGAWARHAGLGRGRAQAVPHCVVLLLPVVRLARGVDVLAGNVARRHACGLRKAPEACPAGKTLRRVVCSKSACCPAFFPRRGREFPIAARRTLQVWLTQVSVGVGSRFTAAS